MYAFWKYNQYPYLLGGKINNTFSPIKEKSEKNQYYIDDYMCYFKCEFTLPDKTGKKLLNEIKNSKIYYQNELDNVKKNAIKLFDETLNKYVFKFDDGTFVRLVPKLSE